MPSTGSSSRPRQDRYAGLRSALLGPGPAGLAPHQLRLHPVRPPRPRVGRLDLTPRHTRPEGLCIPGLAVCLPCQWRH
jgi:hypothetical protein